MAKIGAVWANESWNDADWALHTWADAASAPATLKDLTTVFVPYVAGLVAADSSPDACTDVRDDLATVIAADYNIDRNTMYDVHLS